MNDGTGVFARLVPDRIRESYLLKFALATGIVLIAVGAAGYGVQAQTSEMLRDDVSTSLTQGAQSDAGSLSEYIDKKRQPARFVSDAAVFREGSSEDIREYLIKQQETKLDADARNVHYIDTRAQRIVASTDENQTGTDIGEEAWFQWYQFNSFDDTIVTDPYKGPGGETRIAVISPIPGVFNGATVVTYDVSGAQNRFTSSINGTATHVVNSGGTVVFADNSDATLKPYLDDEDASSIAIEQGSKGESGFVSDPAVSEQREGNYVLAYAPVAGTDWTIMKAVPAANAYAVAQAVERGLLALIGVGLVGVVFLGGTIGRNTVTTIRRLSGRAAAIESGDYDVTVESGRVDEIGRLYDSIVGMRDGLVEQIEQADEAQAEAEAARQEAEAMSRRLEATADEYGEEMAACADGDLTRRLEPDVESDAMCAVASSFNAMLDEWEETVVSVQSVADAVENTTAESESSIVEIETASREVSEAAQRITDATREQREQAAAAADETSDLSATVEEITATAATVASTAEGTAEAGETGREAASDAITELEAIREQTNDAVESVERLNGRMAEIGEVAEVIADIAEETNVLALNASIEAARAADGTSGDGFAVVAEEVKSLAAETKDSAKEIEALIESVTAQTEDTVEEIQEVSSRVENGSKTVSEALTALEDIADKAGETNAGVQEISDATDTQATATEEVSSKTDRVAELSDDTSAETENVAAAAEEQAAQIESTAQRMDELADHVADLRAELNAFEARADVGLVADAYSESGAGKGTAPVDSRRATDGGGPADE